jgi:hypothetical protein
MKTPVSKRVEQRRKLLTVQLKEKISTWSKKGTELQGVVWFDKQHGRHFQNDWKN